MAGMSISGLASGLDTDTMIKQLMQLEALPQTALKTKVSKQNSQITALQAVNAKVAALATAAKAMAKPAGWAAVSATSSSPSVTATTTSGAREGALQFTVQQLAGRHSVATAAVQAPADDPTATPTLQIQRVGQDPVTVTAASWDPAVIAKAISDSAAGVSAVAVQSSPGEHRLQLTADDSGAAAAFTITGGNGSLASGSTLVTQGQDAKLHLGGDLYATSSTNSFEGLATGVGVTVSAVTTDPVTITVDADDAATTKSAKGVVDALNAALTDVKSRTRVASGAVEAGVLVGDSLLRGLAQRLQSAVTTPAAGASLSTVGIEFQRDGSVSFDEEAFAEALADDPGRVQRVVADLAGRLATIAGEASGSAGSITKAVQSRQDAVRGLNDRIDDWDVRLELREATLTRQWSALEVALQGLQGQSSWLSSALAGLPSTKSSS